MHTTPLPSRTTDKRGAFVRTESHFRNWITPTGEAGPTGVGGFKAEPDRYHLYVALNCPWAHRTLIFRALKRLEEIISVSIAHPQRTERGWAFREHPGCTPEHLYGCDYLQEIYRRAVPDYNGRITVPVLWDKQQQVIVNNESADIIRMFNSAFDALTDVHYDYYPPELRMDIDAINDLVYRKLNNGVYRAGFAQSQQAYEAACADVFDGLDELEARLSNQRYLVGQQITEADWRLFPTLVRFDLAYHGVFRCNQKRLVDYPNLWDYTRELYQTPGIAATVNIDHIKLGYWRKSERNPSGIIPLGPALDFTQPHTRDRLESTQ